MHRATKAALPGAVLLLVCGLACDKHEPAPVERSKPKLPTSARAPTNPPTIADPLDPGRPMTIDESRAHAGAANWVKARPGFQSSRNAAERGGIEPCAVKAADTSGFEDWSTIGRGKFTAPRALALDESGGFDLVIHLLG